MSATPAAWQLLAADVRYAASPAGAPRNGPSAQGEVVWRGHEAWEVGIALAEPDAGFWGVKI